MDNAEYWKARAELAERALADATNPIVRQRTIVHSPTCARAQHMLTAYPPMNVACTCGAEARERPVTPGLAP